MAEFANRSRAVADLGARGVAGTRPTRRKRQTGAGSPVECLAPRQAVTRRSVAVDVVADIAAVERLHLRMADDCECDHDEDDADGVHCSESSVVGDIACAVFCDPGRGPDPAQTQPGSGPKPKGSAT